MAEEQPPAASGEEAKTENPAPQAAAPPSAEAPAPVASAPVADPAPVADAAAPVADATTSPVAAAVDSTDTPPQAAAADAPAAAPSTDDATAQLEAAASSDEQKAIDDLLKQATFEDPQAVAQNLPPTATLDLPSFSQVAKEAQASSIDLLRDVDLNVKIELGRSQMLVEDVLKLGEGSVVELDKLAGDPVDVFVNERLVARGEVLVLNDNFCVRINEIVAGVKEEGL